MKRPTVYILVCRNKSLYVGVTSDLEGRLWDHHNGTNDSYTKRNRPVKLVWSGEFQTVRQAIAFEKQVKGWRQDKKLALIEGRYADLPDLALPYNEKRGERTYPSVESCKADP